MGQNLQKESWILKDFSRICKNCDKLSDLRFEKLAFRQRIYEISDEFGVLRFGKFAFGRLRSKKFAFSQRICEKSGQFPQFSLNLIT